jgi:Domain of unknown function (DUF4175)
MKHEPESLASSATLRPVEPATVALVAQLRSARRSQIRPAAQRTLIALSIAAVLGLAHVARIGTPVARGIAIALLVALPVGLLIRVLVLHLRSRRIETTILETIGSTNPELAQASIRALGLIKRTEKDPTAGSFALAKLHLTRLLGRVSLDDVTSQAMLTAHRWAVAGVCFSVLALGAVAFEPMRVVEGLDVLAARDNRAPVNIEYVEVADMTAKPPAYLHQHATIVPTFEPTSLPRGTTITVRGRPTLANRDLFLTDGVNEVPFAFDGAGGLVARWELGDSVDLRVAARFGHVRILQEDVQHITSIPDLAPKVIVEGAPKTIRMLEQPEILLSYEATDDHGLRQVDLVYRSGTKEVRKVLSRPQGDPLTDRGSHRIVFTMDPFWQKNFAPVEVSIEAKDNDPIAGPNWGKSAAILVLPPEVGEAEAMRYEALVRVRDALTDLLADRLVEPAPAGKQSAEHLRKEREWQEKATKAIEVALGESYGGLRFPRRAVSLTKGQLRRLAKALTEEKDKPSAATHDTLVSETEAVLLAVDAAVLGLASKDAAKVAKRLSEVAEEAAEGAATADGRRRGDVASGVARLDASVTVLGGGGKQLLRLGALGADLGEIVQNGLRRIDRARQAKSLLHAELAARDLAARLKNPLPSSMGGGGSRLGDGEVGSGTGTGGGEGQGTGDSSQADDAAEAGAKALEDLIQEHAGETSDVERALEQAFAQDELDALKSEAKKHAQAIRDAAQPLPKRPGEPGSASSSAKRARDLAESMADALEQGRPGDAVQAGKEALKALEDARGAGEQAEEWDLREQSAGRTAENAKGRIAEELEWAEGALEKLRRSAANRAKGELEKSGKREGKLAEKARDIAQKGESGEGSLPDDTLEKLDEAEREMQEAAKALEQGDGIKGGEHQQNAQRLLEMARNGENDGDSEGGRLPRDMFGDGKEMAKKAKVPGKEEHKGPDAFRKRVLKGLSGSSDPLLKDAVKRYTEGLLR